jgi:polysaccharide biosynthesis/export protein
MGLIWKDNLRRPILTIFALSVLSGASAEAHGAAQPGRPAGALPPLTPEGEAGGVPSYRLAPRDVIKLTVLGEPDLSDAALAIDADGYADVPYLGRTRAAGATTGEFGRTVAQGFAKGYLVDPHVTVSLVTSATLRYAVEGSVHQPGVFDLSGPTTLLQALAKAQSPTRTADLRKVAIIRTSGPQRTGALFDLVRIREGRGQDPAIEPGDTIVVTSSWSKAAFQDLLTAAPALAIFRPY